MTKSLLLTSLVLALLLGACAPATMPAPISTRGPSPLASPLEGQAASREITISYHRSGGFSGTDDTWTLSADGTVSHQGQTSGTPEQLTAAQMAELTAAISAANFMSLDDSYVPKDTCCDRYLYEITVTIDGHSKTVRTIDASPTAPAELTHLVDTLNRLVAAPSPAS
jgi:Emfourin